MPLPVWSRSEIHPCQAAWGFEGLEFWLSGLVLEFRDLGLGFWASAFRVWGFGFRV